MAWTAATPAPELRDQEWTKSCNNEAGHGHKKHTKRHHGRALLRNIRDLGRHSEIRHNEQRVARGIEQQRAKYISTQQYTIQAFRNGKQHEIGDCDDRCASDKKRHPLAPAACGAVTPVADDKGGRSIPNAGDKNQQTRERWREPDIFREIKQHEQAHRPKCHARPYGAAGPANGNSL